MTNTLRVLLFIAALLTAYWILIRIRKLKVKMEDAIYWVVFAVILSLLGLFPELTYKLTALVGVQSPANLVFLIIIALLVEKIFTLSIVVSQLEDKIAVLSAEVAIRSQAADRETDQIRRQMEEAEGQEVSVGTSEAESKVPGADGKVPETDGKADA